MTLLIRFWREIAIVVLLGVIGAQVSAIDSLQVMQDQIVQAATDATVKPDKNGKKPLLRASQVPAAIKGLQDSLKDCDGALTRISEQAKADSARALDSDLRLAATLAAHEKESGQLNKALDALRARKSSGDKDIDCAVIDDDSKAAYQGWRK